jgi:arsenate reductase (thioredoxin)
MVTRNGIVLASVFASAMFSVTHESAASQVPLADYVSARVVEFEKIPAARRELLNEVVAYARLQSDSQRPIQLTFICTHNSRRSQMAQIWAKLAADHYRIPNVETFSGGTEATAFNPRAVAALARAGVTVDLTANPGNADNPRYQVRLGNRKDPLVCFSKVYSQTPNPDSDFAAVMTCSEADKKCPDVAGAKVRISLPYDDPKLADGTSDEPKAYDERCAQIATEMLYVFSQLASHR